MWFEMELRHLKDDELRYEMTLRQIDVGDPERVELLERALRRERKHEAPPPKDTARLTRQSTRQEVAECDAKLTMIASDIHEAMRTADDGLLTSAQSRLRHVDGRIRRLWAYAPTQAIVQQLMARVEEVNQHSVAARDMSGAGDSAAGEESLAAVDAVEKWPETNHLIRRSVTPTPGPPNTALVVEGGAAALPNEELAVGGVLPKTSSASTSHGSNGLPGRLLVPIVGRDAAERVMPAAQLHSSSQHDEVAHQRLRSYPGTSWKPFADNFADDNIYLPMSAPHTAAVFAHRQPQSQQRDAQASEIRPLQGATSQHFSQRTAHQGQMPGYIQQPFSQPQVRWLPLDGEDRYGRDEDVRRPYEHRESRRVYDPNPGVPASGNRAYHEERAHGGGAGQRMHQWTLRFDGGAGGLQAQEFIFRVEDQARFYGVEPGALVIGFGMLLRGRAEEWYWIYRRQHVDATWVQLRGAFVERYGPCRETDYDLRAKMDKRRQKPGEYFTDFCQDVEALAVRLTYPMRQGELVELLRRNMSMELQKALWRVEFADAGCLRRECADYERRFRSSEDHQPHRRVHEVRYVEEDAAPFTPPGTCFEPQETWQQVDALQASNPNRNDLTICWNCKDIGHGHAQCPQVQTRLFCYRCGADGVVVKDCKACALNGGRNGMMAPSRSQQPRPQVQIARNPVPHQIQLPPSGPSLLPANTATVQRAAPPNAFRTNPQ